VTAYVWREVRERAVRLFGELPHAQTEADALEVFEREPATVAAAVEHIGRQVAAGSVRSGWAVLRAHLRSSAAAGEVVADDARELERELALAEAWVRNAGVHFDRELEVDEALFDERGRLHAWAGDELVRERLLELWRAERPRCERAERDELKDAARWREIRKRIDEAGRARRPEAGEPNE
jgi:hypothetical protein